MAIRRFAQGENIQTWSRRIQDIMEEMRHRSFCDYRASGTWLPTVNIYETRASYHICVELAGLTPESVTVECLDPQHICIAGQRGRPHSSQLQQPFSVELMEIDEGPFYREIDFGEAIQEDAIEVAYETGFLWITLRKKVIP